MNPIVIMLFVFLACLLIILLWILLDMLTVKEEEEPVRPPSKIRMDHPGLEVVESNTQEGEFTVAPRTETGSWLVSKRYTTVRPRRFDAHA